MSEVGGTHANASRSPLNATRPPLSALADVMVIFASVAPILFSAEQALIALSAGTSQPIIARVFMELFLIELAPDARICLPRDDITKRAVSWASDKPSELDEL